MTARGRLAAGSVALMALSGCASGVGSAEGDRDGTSFSAHYDYGKIGLVGKVRSDGAVIDFVTVARASDHELSCADLALDWPNGADPRFNVVQLPTRSDGEDLAAVLGFNWGQSWEGSPGAAGWAIPEADERDGMVPNVSSPSLTEDNSAWTFASAVALGHRSACEGSIDAAETGFVGQGELFEYEATDTLPASFDELTLLAGDGDPVGFAFDVESGSMTARGELTLEACAPLLMDDPTVPDPVDDCTP